MNVRPEFSNTSLTRAVDAWLTAVPRWGHTQADDLAILLEEHGAAVARSRLPARALAHTPQLAALLEAGFSLSSVDIGDSPSLRWCAVILNAPLATHAILDAHGVGGVDPGLFDKQGRKVADGAFGHSLRYLAQALPEHFSRVTQTPPALLTMFAVNAWVKTQGPEQRDALMALLENGLSVEELHGIGERALPGNAPSFRAKWDREVLALREAFLQQALPATPARAPRRL